MTDSTRNPSDRPRVICHMMTSIDARIVTGPWPDLGDGRREYERVHKSYDADAWMCGRVTMEPFAGGVRSEADVARQNTGTSPRADFKAEHTPASYTVAIDPSGRLAWTSNDIDGDHVIAVLTERVSDEYLAFLRSRSVSYLFAGARDVDFGVALRKLASDYGIRTLMLEGGGKINGALLGAGFIDEVSVLVSPVADGLMNTPTLFDVEHPGAGYSPAKLELLGVEQRAAGVVWLRYRVAAGAE